MTLVFGLFVGLFLFSLYMVIEQRCNRSGKLFNIYSLSLQVSMIPIIIFTGFSIGKLVALAALFMGLILLVLTKLPYKVGVGLCTVVCGVLFLYLR